MPPPVLFSLDLEESLVTSLLLHDQHEALQHFADADLWYHHLSPITGAVRALNAAGKPSGTVFVLFLLEPILDTLEWRGDRGEAMLLDLLSRHTFDVQAFHGESLGRLVHHYAEKRLAVERAQLAAQMTYDAVLQTERARYQGEL